MAQLLFGGTAVPAGVLSGDTFSAGTNYLAVGTMPIRGPVNIIPNSSVQSIQIGYHDGTGTVAAVTVPVANVLAGTTIAGQAGTMVNRSLAALAGGYASALSVKMDGGGNIVMEPPTGFYTSGVNAGGYGSVLANDPNFTAANIRKDVSVFNLVGTGPKYSIGDTLTAGAWVTSSNTANQPVAAGAHLYNIVSMANISAINDKDTGELYALNTSTLVLTKYALNGSTIWTVTCPAGSNNIRWDGVGTGIIVQSGTSITKYARSDKSIIYSRTNPLLGSSFGFVEDKDGNYIISAADSTNGRWIRKYTSSFSQVWTYTSLSYNTSQPTAPASLQTDSTGGILAIHRYWQQTDQVLYYNYLNTSGSLVYNKAYSAYYDGYTYYDVWASAFLDPDTGKAWFAYGSYSTNLGMTVFLPVTGGTQQTQFPNVAYFAYYTRKTMNIITSCTNTQLYGYDQNGSTYKGMITISSGSNSGAVPDSGGNFMVMDSNTNMYRRISGGTQYTIIA